MLIEQARQPTPATVRLRALGKKVSNAMVRLATITCWGYGPLDGVLGYIILQSVPDRLRESLISEGCGRSDRAERSIPRRKTRAPSRLKRRMRGGVRVFQPSTEPEDARPQDQNQSG